MALIDNLVSYYKLDESSGNASDSVGDNTLTNVGTLTYNTGKINNGAVCASGKYLSSPNTDFSFGTGTAFSISFWFKTSSVSANQFILSNEQETPFTGYVFFINESVDQFEANFINNFSSSRLNFRATTTTITTDTWYHVTLTYDGTANTNNAAGFKVFINNTEQTLSVVTNTLTTNNFASTATMYFGARRYDTAQYLSGTLDEIGIWSGALSSDEVTELYNSGNGKQHPFGNAYTLACQVTAYTLTGINILMQRATKLTTQVTAYTLTGIDIALSKGWKIIGGVGEFILTGKDIIISGFGSWKMKNEAKSSTSTFTNQSKTSSSWTNQSKS
jgi:hypothetical protein